MAELRNPHDAFFRETMGREDVARDFLARYLPDTVAQVLALDTLRVLKDSFIDSELQEHFSDLLFAVNQQNGEPASVYLLFEHKSYPEPNIALQLLRYMVRIWEATNKQKQRPGPIVPLVIYHGAKRWNIGTSLHDWVATPHELAPFLPDFQYWLFDLSQYSDEELQGEAYLRVMLLVLKYIFRDELRERLPEVMQLLTELSQQQYGLQYIEVVLRYLVAGTEKVDAQELQDAVETAFQGGNLMGTIAQSWMEQGLEQGLLEGMELALELKFGESGLALLPELRRIEDVAALRALRDGIRTANSPEELRRFFATHKGAKKNSLSPDG